jgi:indole-3-glycerol phosphate synthase
MIPRVLADIVAHKRQELVSLAPPTPLPQPLPPDSEKNLLRVLRAHPGLALIAEIKPKSPAAGRLTKTLDLDTLLTAYNAHAQAISVLTDARYFGGSWALLGEVASRSALPTLCKEFVLSPVQVQRARQAGAGAVLLIVKILEDALLDVLLEEVRRWGMTPVVEVQTLEECHRALAFTQPQTDALLINNRNLDTLEVSLETTRLLAPHLPPAYTLISASGIASPEDVVALLPFCRAFLVGSHFMRAANPAAALAQLRAVGPSPS